MTDFDEIDLIRALRPAVAPPGTRAWATARAAVEAAAKAEAPTRGNATMTNAVLRRTPVLPERCSDQMRRRSPMTTLPSLCSSKARVPSSDNRGCEMTDHNNQGRRRVSKSTAIMWSVGILAVVGALAGLRASEAGQTSRVRAIGTNHAAGMKSAKSTSVTSAGLSVNPSTSGRLPWKTTCPTPSDPDPAQVPGPDVKLTWLPSGANAQYRQDCRFPGASFVQVDLPGRANADTVPATGIPSGWRPATGGPWFHPAGYISVEARAMSVPPRQLPLPSDDSYTRVTTSVNGHPATVLYPTNNGLGGYNIGWMQNGIYVQVHTDRGLTPDGVSGVPLSQLEQVAAGVRLG